MTQTWIVPESQQTLVRTQGRFVPGSVKSNLGEDTKSFLLGFVTDTLGKDTRKVCQSKLWW